MAKAVSIQMGPRQVDAIKRISPNDPEGSWRRAPDNIKWILYDTFGSNDLYDLIGKEPVLEYEIHLALEGELPLRDRIMALSRSPRRTMRTITNDI